MTIGEHLNSEFSKLSKAVLAKEIHERNQPPSAEAKELLHRLHQSASVDPLSDGDQFVITDEKQAEVIKKSWSPAAELTKFIQNHDPHTNFHLFCFYGQAAHVTAYLINEQGKGTQYLRTLLESRETYFRYSPLHFACIGAKRLNTSNAQVNHKRVVELLCEFGARADSKDIGGFTPLIIASSYGTNDYSLSLVYTLVKAGADPNSKTRISHPVLFSCFFANDKAAFRTLLDVGADLDAKFSGGYSPRDLARDVPTFAKIISTVYRKKINELMSCSYCSSVNATKHCGACLIQHYCSKSCQLKDWKKQHKEECGKKPSQDDHIDIDLDIDITDQIAKGWKVGDAGFTNFLNDKRSVQVMKANLNGKSFVVKVSNPIHKFRGSSIKINIENSDYFLIGNNDEKRSAFYRLKCLFDGNVLSLNKIYVAARWIRAEKNGEMSTPAILRLYTSVLLPPPIPMW